MCGIAGFIGRAPKSPDKVSSVLNKMMFRGPDHQGIYSKKINNHNCLLLHSRLAIVDLDHRSNQPFTKNNVTLIFNGEIYNYMDLRKLLIKRGHNFFTDSDTEVLLNCYLEFGEKCLNYLDGMWAFAILDLNNNRLFCSRDRFGEKPLYYFSSSDGFYFASETTFIRTLSESYFKVNKKQIYRHLVNGYKSLYKTDETYYSNIYHLLASQYLSIDLNSTNIKIRPKTYYRHIYKPNNSLTEKECVYEVRDLLLKSVETRIKADVDVTYCLSGGVDSAGLVSIAKNIFGKKCNTFSIIDSNPDYSEIENIRAVVKNLKCNAHFITPKPQPRPEDSIDRLTKLIDYHDAPLPTITFYLHSLLSENITKSGYKISISGTAADEIFTGYYDHFNLYFAEIDESNRLDSNLKVWKEKVLPFIRNKFLQNPNLYKISPNFRDHIYDGSNTIKQVIRYDYNEDFREYFFTPFLLRNRMLNELLHEATPCILHEDDLNSMYNSVENRSPYLSKALTEFVSTIPTKFLIKNGTSKFILRSALNNILCDSVRTDYRKVGFNGSAETIFGCNLNTLLSNKFLNNDSPIFEFVDKSLLTGLTHINNDNNAQSKFVFNLLSCNQFLARF